jgi:hypothetical protein
MHFRTCGAPRAAAYGELKFRTLHLGRHERFAATLEGSSQLHITSALFPEKGRLTRSHSRSGRFRKQKKSCPCLQSDLRFLRAYIGMSQIRNRRMCHYLKHYSVKFYYFYVTSLSPGYVCFLLSRYVCRVDGTLIRE